MCTTALYLYEDEYPNEWIWSPVALDENFGKIWWAHFFRCLLNFLIPVPNKNKKVKRKTMITSRH